MIILKKYLRKIENWISKLMIKVITDVRRK